MDRKKLHFVYSEEQGILGDTAKNMLRKKCTFEKVREWMETQEGFSSDIWREMAELGWMGVAIPEEYGGSGLGATELTAIVEPMGRYLLASPFLATTLGGQLLLVAGSEEQKKRWLPEIAGGERIITLALYEPEGSWEPGHIKAEAKENADGYLLTGTKCSILDGQNADLLIAGFLLDDKPALFLIEPEHLAGLEPAREMLVDETRRSTRMVFDQFQLPKHALITDNALPSLKKVHNLAWLLFSADMAGGCEGVFQLTLDFLQVRKQFGRPIGSFQALKHPMANIMIDIENSRSLVYYAASVLDGDSAESEIAARMAKAYTGEMYGNAVNRAIQFHGATGYTWECHAQLYFRRAQWEQFSFGDAIHHRRHLAQLLL